MPRSAPAAALAPAHFTTANAVGLHAGEIAAEDEHERRQQDEHRHVSSSAFQNDRREGAGGAHAPWVVRRLPARKYGRMTSPARAGSTALAAKPTAVARNALAKVVAPSGSSRILPAQGANREIGEHRRQRNSQPSGPRARDLPRARPKIHVVQEQRDQRQGERQNDDGAERGDGA